MCSLEKAIDAFQLDDEHVFGEEVCEVVSYGAALVYDWKRDFGSGPDTAEAKLLEERTLIDLLQESSAEDVGHLEYGCDDAFG